MDFSYVMKDNEFECEMEITSLKEIEGPIVTLECWLRNDGRWSAKPALKAMKEALENENFEPICIDGEAYDCEVGREFCIIHFILGELYWKTKDYITQPCKIPTKLLYEITQTWLMEYEKWCAERDAFQKAHPNYRPKTIGTLEEVLKKMKDK